MNLEQQKKLARELLRAVRVGEAEALVRLRLHHGRWAVVDDATVRQLAALHDTQVVVAREQGFASWAKLKAYAEPSEHSRHTRLFVADVAWIADRVRGLMTTRKSAGPAAIEQIREWHPRFADSLDEEILRAEFSEEDARMVYAREHGFDTWAELEKRVGVLAQRNSAVSTEPFLSAFEALQSGDVLMLKALLKAHPRIAKARGTNGNTLLNLAGSIQAKRSQSTPERDDDLAAVRALLEAGAEVNEGNDRGWTPLHQAGYSNQIELAALLIQHGAALDAEAHGAGGTPLVAALFWGHREVADLLGSQQSQSPAPNNLRVAAGLGRPELVEACFSGESALLPEAGSARGFYRPHSGFPDWHPSNDPQEILDEALVWACKSGRVAVLERLVRAGARVGADPYRGTPLIWAAFCNRTEAAEWLLDHGADVNQKATFGGLSHGQGITALHLAAQCGHLATAKLLVERGADLSIQEDLYHATAEGAADYFGQVALWNYLRACQT